MSNPIRVLLVENDLDDVSRVTKLLSQTRDNGFQITTAGTLADAIDELQRNEFDALLLALILPDSKGVETFHRIQLRARHLPVVIYSSISDEDTAMEAVRSGAQDYVVKGSVDGITLGRVIRYAIERKKHAPSHEPPRDPVANGDLYRHMVEYSQGLICTHDLEGVILSINPAAARSLGYAPDEMVGRNLREFMSPARSVAVGPYLERLRTDGVDSGLLPVITRDGADRLWQYRNALFSQPGAPVYVIGYAQDVTDLMNARDELRRLALTDELTGLHNRRAFLSLSEHALKVARRTQLECQLFYADVDDLKRVNDTQGHHAGSTLIAEAAVILRSVFRDSDIVARVGGDEFAVLAIDLAESNAGVLIDRLQSRLREFNERRERPYILAFSIGVASFTSGTVLTVDELMQQADYAMYEKKKQNQAERK